MTVIEFYDKTAIENIIGALLCDPEKMILVGDDANAGKKSAALYKKVLSARGQKTEIKFKKSDRNDLKTIVRDLSKIVEENDECVFDLTGGEDLYLVAVGIIMERYKEKVRCHRFDLNDETVTACDDTGKICRIGKFDISVEECIKIYGGELVTDPKRISYTQPWDFSEEFVNDIRLMWSVCKKNPRLWNSFVATVSGSYDKSQIHTDLKISFKNDKLAELSEQKGEAFESEKAVAIELQKLGIIHIHPLKDRVLIRFKNAQIKKCLTVSGQVLELAVACAIRDMKDENGEPLCRDVKVGVVIDWNDKDGNDFNTNEIDVFAIKGVCPVFISCKNGAFDVNELYKLNTVSERFGSKYAKKALVTTQTCSHVISARMTDMGICRLDRIAGGELEKKLRGILE